MPASITLHPQSKPLPLPPGSEPYGANSFRPCIVEEHGVVIVGGPNALHVFQFFQRQRLWFSIPARITLSGFAVNGGTLYVQDGPVLSSWDLSTAVQVGSHSEGVRLAGINLLTSAVWTYDQTLISDAQLAALHQLPPAQAETQMWRREQARRTAWNTLLADLQALGPGTAGLREHIGHSVGLDGGQPETPPAGGDALTFSAPVVRQQQIDAAVGGVVFVLGGDGMFYALDGEIKHLTRQKVDLPGQLELTLVEVPSPQDANTVQCFLYYPLAAGGIRRLDVTSATLQQGGWPGPPPAAPLPPHALAWVGGQLWAREALGRKTVALPLEPPGAPTFTQDDEAGAWRDSEINAASALVLLTSESQTRLLAFQPGAATRDRWRAVAHAPSWMHFVPDAPLVLQIEHEVATPDGNIPITVRAANTVGAADPSLCTTYPHPPAVQAAGALTPGPFGLILPRIAALATRPIIHRHLLFGVASANSRRQWLAAWSAPRAGSPSVGESFIQSQPADGLLTAFPPAITREALIACSLMELIQVAGPPATAELEHNRTEVGGIVIPVQNIGSGWVNAVTLIVTNAAGAEVQRRDIGAGNGSSIARVDAALEGMSAHVLPSSTGYLDPTHVPASVRKLRWSSNQVTLRLAGTEPLQIVWNDTLEPLVFGR